MFGSAGSFPEWSQQYFLLLDFCAPLARTDASTFLDFDDIDRSRRVGIRSVHDRLCKRLNRKISAWLEGFSRPRDKS